MIKFCLIYVVCFDIVFNIEFFFFVYLYFKLMYNLICIFSGKDFELLIVNGWVSLYYNYRDM